MKRAQTYNARLNVETAPRKSRGRPKPYIKVTRRVDPMMAAFRERRLALGMTQDAVAARVGCCAGAISDGETGLTQPTLITLRCWAEVLEMKITLEESHD